MLGGEDDVAEVDAAEGDADVVESGVEGGEGGDVEGLRVAAEEFADAGAGEGAVADEADVAAFELAMEEEFGNLDATLPEVGGVADEAVGVGAPSGGGEEAQGAGPAGASYRSLYLGPRGLCAQSRCP